MALNVINNRMSLVLNMGMNGTKQVTRTVSVNSIKSSFNGYETFSGHVAAVLGHGVLSAKVVRSYLIV